MRTIIPILCLSVILFMSCNHAKQNSRRVAAPKDYSVITLVPKSVTIHKDFPATIEGQQVIEIRPMISGYIREIKVREGDHVNKGQVLFIINNPQYEQAVLTAKAQINSSEADVNSARMEIEKVKPLVEKQIVSEYRLKSAELTLQAKEAALAQAHAALANAEANLGYTIIKSPQDGIIGTIPYKAGALVSSNSAEALTTLSDITNVFAYFSWNEKQLLDFLSDSQGTTVEEKVKNMPEATLILANEKEYESKGKIEMASGLISTETGTATFKAVFPNPNGLIRSGSSAKIQIPEIIDSVLIIPQSATYELQDKRFIYTVGPDNKVTATNFISIPSDDGKFFLATGGLKAGDRIVIEGVASLRDGTVIVTKETDANNIYGNID
ncbi:MAG TPA: efflux RND transporter periplasmic adaptor subunit [Bacteroidales bacterium]|nr:efflux RND transporter periplasmic adaptor subunit [Bacteroidales bacterium]HPT20958.1 efflux RND transporter periplasmic adaptor subunit [Bacteroidales bacterium]